MSEFSQVKEAKTEAVSLINSSSKAPKPSNGDAPKPASKASLGRAWWVVGGVIALIAILIAAGAVWYQLSDKNTDIKAKNQDNVRTFSTDGSTLPSPTPIASTLPQETMSIKAGIPVANSTASQPTFSPELKGATYDTQKSAVNTTTAEVHDAFKQNDSLELYKLFSSQLTDMFTADNLAKAFGVDSNVDVQPVGDPIISTDWAKQKVTFTSAGKTSQYDMILHKENGEWKLFGTMDVN